MSDVSFRLRTVRGAFADLMSEYMDKQGVKI